LGRQPLTGQGDVALPAQRTIAMSRITVCAADEIEAEDVIRFDHGGRSFAIYRSPDDAYYATDGYCTHEQAHLAAFRHLFFGQETTAESPRWRKSVPAQRFMRCAQMLQSEALWRIVFTPARPEIRAAG
jgi:hypothetical protein